MSKSFDELLESVDFEYYLILEFLDSLLFDYCCVKMHYHYHPDHILGDTNRGQYKTWALETLDWTMDWTLDSIARG